MEPKQAAEQVLLGRSSLLGAMAWMFGLSFVLTLLLGWVPVVGPFIGPVVGGFIGGSRAGSPGRALMAALLPALMLTMLILAVGLLAAAIAKIPIVGAVAAVIAGALGVILVVQDLMLFGASFAGGLARQFQDR